jgi:hypothetical protein
MMPYKRIYLHYFGYGQDDFISCEVCGERAVDVHHIDNKGMGGSKTKDYIENLIGVCRLCHNKAHDNKLTKEFLTEVHLKFMEEHR